MVGAKLDKRRSVLALVLAMGVGWPLLGLGAAVTQQDFFDALRSRPDQAHGQQLFARCASCHGMDGGGSADGLVPAIAGQHRRVLIRQLVDYRHSERWDLRMESVARSHLLPDAQAIADVAAYVSELPRTPVRGVGSGEAAAYGRQVYARLCASCHGAEGEGDDAKEVPRLAGQHYAYLLRQLYDAVDGRRPDFPAAHVRLLKRFERSDFVGVADYLSRLGTTP
jgi:cytochrome c553